MSSRKIAICRALLENEGIVSFSQYNTQTRHVEQLQRIDWRHDEMRAGINMVIEEDLSRPGSRLVPQEVELAK